MNKPLYLFLFIILISLSFVVLILMTTKSGAKEKYFTDTGTLYIGEVGCSSIKNFDSLEESKKLNLLFPKINFSNDVAGTLKFRSRFSLKDKNHIEKTINEEVLPYLNKRFDFFQSIEECVVFPTRPYLISFKSLEVDGQKYKVLSYALVIFFLLLFIIFLSTPKLKRLFFKKADS